jgi:hypothetical protein
MPGCSLASQSRYLESTEDAAAGNGEFNEHLASDRQIGDSIPGRSSKMVFYIQFRVAASGRGSPWSARIHSSGTATMKAIRLPPVRSSTRCSFPARRYPRNQRASRAPSISPRGTRMGAPRRGQNRSAPSVRAMIPSPRGRRSQEAPVNLAGTGGMRIRSSLVESSALARDSGRCNAHTKPTLTGARMVRHTESKRCTKDLGDDYSLPRWAIILKLDH